MTDEGMYVTNYAYAFAASRDKTLPDDGQYIWRGTQLDLSTQNFLPPDMALLLIKVST